MRLAHLTSLLVRITTFFVCSLTEHYSQWIARGVMLGSKGFTPTWDAAYLIDLYQHVKVGLRR